MLFRSANEAVDAISQFPAPRVGAALNLVAQRYARVLNTSAKDVNEALESARAALKSGAVPRRRIASEGLQPEGDDADPTEVTLTSDSKLG